MVYAFAANGGGRGFLRMRRDFGKNVYFCFWEKSSWFKALCWIHVYFCIPGPKRPFEENQGVSLKKCLLLHTFDYLSRWAGGVSFDINGLSATDA